MAQSSRPGELTAGGCSHAFNDRQPAVTAGELLFAFPPPGVQLQNSPDCQCSPKPYIQLLDELDIALFSS